MSDETETIEQPVKLSGQTWAALIGIIVTLALAFGSWCYWVQSQVATLDRRVALMERSLGVLESLAEKLTQIDKRVTVREANAFTPQDATKITGSITDLTITVAKLGETVMRLSEREAETRKSQNEWAAQVSQLREAMIRLETKLPTTRAD